MSAEMFRRTQKRVARAEPNTHIPAEMNREEMADVLERIALLLELKGENPFKVRAYRQ